MVSILDLESERGLNEFVKWRRGTALDVVCGYDQTQNRSAAVHMSLHLSPGMFVSNVITVDGKLHREHTIILAQIVSLYTLSSSWFEVTALTRHGRPSCD